MNIIVFYKQLLVETRHWLKMVVVWFLIGTVIGGLVFFVVPDLLEKILSIFEEKFGGDPALDFNLVIAIFLNNLQASALGLFGGLLVGLGPFVVVMTNGFFLGYILVSFIFLSENGWETLGYFAVGILPHGILEIPAFLIAAAIGLKLGIEWLKKENYGQRIHVLGQNFKKALYAIPLIVLLLFIAAIIEVFVSGKLLEKIV